MSLPTTEAERIVNILEYLDNNIQYLSDIYKCPCESCIKSNTERIMSIVDYIISFYKFIIKNKTIIKQNEHYFIQIKSLLINMYKFNTIIFKEDETKNSVYFNTQKSVSIIYLEEEDIYIYEKPFSIDNFIKYYPELISLF